MKRLLMFILPLAVITMVSCKKDVTRDDFEGTWNASDSYVDLNGTTITRTYKFTVTKSPSAENEILIAGFGELSGDPVKANVSGSNFTIPSFNITVNGVNGTFAGTGSIDDDELTYTYSIASPSVSVTYNGKATR
ncbi:MAG: hypothetical protein IPI60_01615 [Saprospiraceae bacterium]|nr:hypothetical protein [Saprospiraceae bacterium]